jgi:hypothetical protein
MGDAMNPQIEAKLATASGQLLSEIEARRLRQAFPDMRLDRLIELWQNARLTGAYVTMPEADDESGFGVDMQWMTIDEVLDEAQNATPGIQAARLGLLPIGKCLMGSAAPYFVDTKSAAHAVVRVPHDAVDARTDILDEGAIESVTPSLEDFFARCTFASD